MSNILELILFADDTNILCTGDNFHTLCKTVCIELDKLNKWFSLNKLSLNVFKTNYMIFCNKKVPDNVNISINNIEIEQVFDTKFLGVVIDHNFSWKEHIKKVSSKLSKPLAILYKAKHLLSKHCLYTLYCSLFLPYINYCSEIWGNTYVTNLNPIYIL